MRAQLLLFFLICLSQLHGKVVLPDMFSDYMVLQQKSSIKIWGLAKPNKCVRIKTSWSDTIYKFNTKKDGNWSIQIQTPAASFTEHTIEFSEQKTITRLSHILIGEVWFCSGQSNMEMTFKGYPNEPIRNAEQVIKEADPNLGIRMLRVKRIGQEAPSNTAEGKWMNSTTQNVPNFSATAYFFALNLRRKLNVPIGIINSSWGGSSVEGWMSRELVEKYTDLDLKEEVPDNENWRKPCIMYNGMLYPFRDFVIRGFVWYQGEANVGRPATYSDKLADMVQLWRNDWKRSDLPFYIVEIAPYEYSDPMGAAKLREAQFNAAQHIPDCHIISTNDLVDETERTNIHPGRKQEVGDRLASLALVKTYKDTSICTEYATFQYKGRFENFILLTFQKTAGKLTLDFSNETDKPAVLGFEIAGRDRVFYPARAYILDDRHIRVDSPLVPDPFAVRYAFKAYSIGNVRNGCGLPLFPFRTDNWEE
jgi:sialate O-acetylesterase